MAAAPDGFGQLSVGGSTLKEHSSLYYQADETRALEVEALDFGSHLARLLAEYPVVVIKMDIEGAEYALLEHLLDAGLLGQVHSLFLEFHSQYMSNESREKYQRWERSLQFRIRQTNCRFLLWR